MKNRTKLVTAAVGMALVAATFGTASLAQKSPPFGGKADVAYSQDLWAALAKANLVGPNAINVRPFEGNEPHGSIQQVLGTTVTVRGHTGRVLVKRNHAGKDVTVQSVYDNPGKNLGAVTVMFKRKAGYDKDNLDWYWVKYKADGTLHKHPKGMLLAGRIAKGADKGCIFCHKASGGKDMETLTDK